MTIARAGARQTLLAFGSRTATKQLCPLIVREPASFQAKRQCAINTCILLRHVQVFDESRFRHHFVRRNAKCIDHDTTHGSHNLIGGKYRSA